MLREWILSIPYIAYWGYFLAFFAAFLETLPAIGLFIPGQTIVVIAGFLAFQHTLSLPLILCLAILGAVLGDLLGFVLGRKYGWSLLRTKRGLARDVAELLRENPFKTLVIGRFNSITRAFAPFVAGASGVKMREFLPANIIGGVIWGLLFTLIGYLFGASYDLALANFDRIIVAIIAVFSIVFVGYLYLKRKRLVNQRTRRLLAINIASITFFSMILYSVGHNGAITGVDRALYNTLLTIPVIALSTIGTLSAMSIYIVLVASGVLCIWLGIKQRYRASILVAISMGGALILDLALKAIIMRPRPEGALLLQETYAFPSGHALISTVFFGLLALTYGRTSKHKTVLHTLCAAGILLIASSRIYLRVHWFSDVVGGILLGAFWLTFVYLANEAHDSWEEDTRTQVTRAVRQKPTRKKK